MAQLIEPDRAQGLVDVPCAHCALKPAAMNRAEPADGAQPGPKLIELGAGAHRPAFKESLREHGGIHRASAAPADALDGNAPILEQPVQHAPCKGAMCAAALKGQIDRALFRRWAPRR